MIYGSLGWNEQQPDDAAGDAERRRAQRGLPLTSLVRLLVSNPARLFGLYPQKGSLLPGADADLAIVDMNEAWTLESEMLFSRHKISPYVGMQFKGRVKRTVVRAHCF